MLVCAEDHQHLNAVLQTTVKTIENAGFEIQPDKVQLTSPWNYLGLRVHERTVKPQQITIYDRPRTLNKLQQLCGSINWVQPILGLSSEDLAPLFNLLKGDSSLNSPRTITSEAQVSIIEVQNALVNRQGHRYDPSLPFFLAILGRVPHLHGLIFQWDEGLQDSLLILEWIFLHHQPTKTIMTPQEAIAQVICKGRTGLCSLAGCDFTCIYLPLATAEELEFFSSTMTTVSSPLIATQAKHQFIILATNYLKLISI